MWSLGRDAGWITTKCSRTNGSPKGNPEGLGEMMKRVLHAVQLAVPIGIITRPNIAQRSNLGCTAIFKQVAFSDKAYPGDNWYIAAFIKGVF